jgi:hypothetical protein
MKAQMAKDPKYGFSQLVTVTHAEPVAVTKHGCPVIEKFECQKALESPATSPAAKRKASA